MQRLLTTPDDIFPDLASGVLLADPVPRWGRLEYAKLVGRQMRSGKIQLTPSCASYASVPPVGKSNGNLREVWNGAELSAKAVRPPKPPHLANPSALVHLEASHDFPLRAYKRDAN